MRRERWAGRVVLVVLVLIGAALRLTNLNWDQYQHVHPDERFIVWVADSISWPQSLAAALNAATSTIDPFRWPPTAGDLAGAPRDYAYGHLPLYLLVGVAHAGQAIAERLSLTSLAAVAALRPWLAAGRILAGYDGLALAGRVISAACDVGTLLLVYVLAASVMAAGRPSHMRRLAGLLAAGAYAFAVLPIQLSHFYGVDLVLTLCVTASVTLAAHWADRGGRWTWIAAGALAGLAVGSKFSGVLVVCPLVMAVWGRSRNLTPQNLTPNPSPRKGGELSAVAASGPAPFLEEGVPGEAGLGFQALTGSARAALVSVAPPFLGEGAPDRAGVRFRPLLVALAAALAAFLLTNPFALIEARAYIASLWGQSAMVSGAMDAPYTRQFIGTLPYWYFIQQLSQWGLGWPLGLAAWGGLVWAVARAGMRRLTPGQLVLVAWALPYFAFTGAFHAKFLRYMAPLVPFLLVFAVGSGLAAWDWLGERISRRERRDMVGGWRMAAMAVVGVIAVFTIGWALAFTGVYRQEHPWLQASRWIYAHAPAGSTILTESWDDALPLAFDGPDGPPRLPEYRRIELPLYDDDTPAKLDTLAGQLAGGDYLVIASNRLARPISRLTARYPMSSQYYRLLAAGDLGYRPVAAFATYPTLAGLTIPDDNADESFTVYDHPHVTVYVNTDHLNAAALRDRLGRYLPEVQTQARGVTKSLAAEILRPDKLRGGVASGTRPEDDNAGIASTSGQSAIRNPQSAIPVLLWWLVMGLFGWLAWPLLFPLLGGLADRGYGLARIAGWLLVGWVHWLAVSLGLWENATLAIVGVFVALTVAGLVAAYVQRRALMDFWRARWRMLLLIEGVFALAFLFFVGVRLLDPDLWQPWNGGEKYMEFAFLNAILRSVHFPPYDPYFAGGTMNYYYFGLYLVSLPIKLTGIAPSIAFNLAIPGLFALTATGVFSLALTLRGATRSDSPLRAAPSALLAVFFALIMGNLEGFWQIVRSLAGLAGEAGPFFTRLIGGVGRVLGGAPFPAYDYWGASRVIPFTINEFPFWTFLFADMHPHLIAMPLGMLVVGLALNQVMQAAARRRPQATASEPVSVGAGISALLELDPPPGSPIRALFWFIARSVMPWAKLGLLVIALGSLGATNTWDLPVYAVLVGGAFLLAAWRSEYLGGLLHMPPVLEGALGLISAALLAVCTTAFAVVAYWPFYANYHVEFGGGNGPLLTRYLAPVQAASPLDTWFLVWGAFLLMAYAFTLYRPAAPLRRSLLPYALALLIGALLWALDRRTAALASIPLILAVAAMLGHSQSSEAAFSRLLLALGLAVVVGIELVYLRDFLDGGDWYRMNTVFKFSMPGWLCLALACAVMVAEPHPPAPSPMGRGGEVLTDEAPPPFLGEGVGGRGSARRGRSILLILVLLTGVCFPIFGTRARVNDRFPGPRPAVGTLDGMAFMAVGRYNWPDEAHTIQLSYDYDAIHWLQDHVTGSPVVAEAPAGQYDMAGQPVSYDYYRAGGLRVSSMTGLPTFVGQHQYEQRSGDAVSERTFVAQEFFRTTDTAQAWNVIRNLHVSYIYVGQLERMLFSAASLAKFDAMVQAGGLAVVYRNPQVTIYAVK